MSVLLLGEQEPNYGKVQDLCHTLGFVRDANKTTRGGHLALTGKTIAFRKNFVKSAARTVFPLRYDDPFVEYCVEEFLDANEQLFKTDAHQSRGPRISVPEDRKLILETLAKLFCTQEMSFRKNDEYLNKKKKQDYAQQDSESEIEVPQDTEMIDAGESTIRVIPKVPQPQPKKVAEPSEADATGSKRSIERHLEYTYPTEEVYETVSSDWLFDNEQTLWPNREKAFAYRYFHERNLYTVTKQNKGQVQRFSQTFQKYLGIANDHARDVIIRSKCKQLVKEISTQWGSEKGNGFLVKTPNGCVKSSQFDRAWKYHRNLWIKKVHDGKIEGVMELNQAPALTPAIKQEEASRKRLHEIEEAPASAAPSASAGPSPKRVRQSAGPQLPLEQRSVTPAEEIQERIGFIQNVRRVLLGEKSTSNPRQPTQTVAPETQVENVAHGQNAKSNEEQPKQSASSEMQVDVEKPANVQNPGSTSKVSAQNTAPQSQVKQTPLPRQNSQSSSEAPAPAQNATPQTRVEQPSKQDAQAAQAKSKDPEQNVAPEKPANRLNSQPSSKEPENIVAPQSQVKQTPIQNPQPISKEPRRNAAPEKSTDKQKSQPTSKEATPNAVPQPQAKQGSTQQGQSSSKEPKQGVAPAKPTNKRKSQPSSKEATPIDSSKIVQPYSTFMTPQEQADMIDRQQKLLAEKLRRARDAATGSASNVTSQTQGELTSRQNSQPNSKESTPNVAPQVRIEETQQVQNQVLSDKENGVAPQPQVKQTPNVQHPLPKKLDTAAAPQTRVEQAPIGQNHTLPAPQQDAGASQPRVERIPVVQSVQNQVVQDRIDGTATLGFMPQYSPPIVGQPTSFTPVQYDPAPSRPPPFTPVQYDPGPPPPRHPDDRGPPPPPSRHPDNRGPPPPPRHPDDRGPPPPPPSRHPDDRGPPPPPPRAPAFTPVNAVPSNGFVPNMQHHTSKIPVGRPLERDSAPQLHRSRSSLPASNSNNDNGNNRSANNSGDLDPSRLARSKSTNSLRHGESDVNPNQAFNRPASTVQDAPAAHQTPPPLPPQSFTPPIITNPNASTANASGSASVPQNPYIPTYNTFTPNTAPMHNNSRPAPINTTNAMPRPNPPPPSQFTQYPRPQHQPAMAQQPPSFQNQSANTPSQPPPPPPPSFQNQSANSPSQPPPPPPPPQSHTPYATPYSTPRSTATSPIEVKPPPTPFNKTLSTPRHTATPEPSTSTPSSRASYAGLKFILENPNRSPDHDNFLTAAEFSTYPLSAFFDLFCERSGRDRTKTEYLMFKYVWGYRDSFIVKEFGNEVEWDEVKERIRDTYLMARDKAGGSRRVSGVGGSGEGAGKNRWQVWVSGPEEEYDEWLM